MRYIIATDLDGTALDGRSSVSPLTKKVLKQLQDMGHIIVIATGRVFAGSIGTYNALGSIGPIVSDNGGIIQNPSDENFPAKFNYIDLVMFKQIYHMFKDNLVATFYSVGTKFILDKAHPDFLNFLVPEEQAALEIRSLENIDSPPTGVCMYIKKDYVETFKMLFPINFGHKFSYRYWTETKEGTIFDIHLNEVSKWSGIKYVQEYYGIDDNHVLTFGDGENDIEMIRECRHGVAMKNATASIKKVAKEITAFDNQNDGLAKYLISFFDLSE